MTGETFSAIHGDLFIELFKKENKATAGPFCSGLSTNTDAVNSWVNTIYIHMSLRNELHKCLSMNQTGTKHKILTPRGKKCVDKALIPFVMMIQNICQNKIIETANISNIIPASKLGMS